MHLIHLCKCLGASINQTQAWRVCGNRQRSESNSVLRVYLNAVFLCLDLVVFLAAHFSLLLTLRVLPHCCAIVTPVAHSDSEFARRCNCCCPKHSLSSRSIVQLCCCTHLLLLPLPDAFAAAASHLSFSSCKHSLNALWSIRSIRPQLLLCPLSLCTITSNSSAQRERSF